MPLRLAISDIRASNAVQVVLLDDPAPAVQALITLGASVSVQDRTLDVELESGDPFVAIRDVLADTGVGLRSMGSKQTTLEDVYLAEEEYQE